uniref:Uncharacterized protein n=1 Tax=Virus NIOZ-UU159 TaxID=2763270 RepID=A0A7S9SV19_9VIRU|nr:MAG: hypothetical protein NIOZUU159_00039 [Virus NIOZ-UU159]
MYNIKPIITECNTISRPLSIFFIVIATNKTDIKKNKYNYILKMENTNNTITSLLITDNNVIVSYDNINKETIPLNTDSYKKMRDTWLKENPPFISDKFKKNMNNIILASIQNKKKSIQELSEFFKEGNEEEIIKFFNYMRTRDLTEEKAKWIKKV